MNLFQKVFIFFTILYLLFFVKTWGSVTGFIYSHDDVVYYAQTASLVNDFDIDIRNNLGQFDKIYLQSDSKTGRLRLYQPLGPSLLYLIPYALAKPFVYLISAVRGVTFDSYDPLFFVVLCFFTLILFYICGLSIKKTLEMFFEGLIPDIVSILALWGTILPVYVFRRPIFSVIPEFFCICLLVYYLARCYKIGLITALDSAVLGGICGLLIITRWNDVYILPLFFIFLLKLSICSRPRPLAIISSWLSCIAIASLFFILQIAVWIKTYGTLAVFLSYYYELHAQFINSKNTFLSYAKNILHIFFGLDWGVIFTMPLLLFGGAVFIFYPKLKIMKSVILERGILLFTFWACLHVVLQWKNTGEFYGYRFLASLLPFCAIGFASLVERSWLKYKKIITYLIIAFCLFNFFVILPFELTDKTTMLMDTVTPMGGKGWGNNSYFINAVSFYYDNSPKTLFSVFARGYLAAVVFGALSLFGVNLSSFSPKIEAYFTLAGYKQYIAFLYPVLVFFLIAYLSAARYNKYLKKISRNDGSL